MEENKLRDLISDLEIVNRNLQIVSKIERLEIDEAGLVREATDLTKRAIQTLAEEEVRMEIYKLSDN
ncbi:MAG: hypothetical protein PF637_12835 [Spirochaetes bacterium]|jgi:hypothetical protein|nr:hypothetical protein [Spirochaetota bacterium]